MIEAKLSKDYEYLDLGKKKDSFYRISNHGYPVSLVSLVG
jgi:hypothetical protein